MQRYMLKSKIHRAAVTGTELDYAGSLTIDVDLLERANILVGEQVHVLNFNNGQRFITYTIPAPRGSGTLVLNGPCAKLANVGDQVIVITYAQMEDKVARSYEPIIVLVDEENHAVDVEDPGLTSGVQAIGHV